jgi:hypothetical protein
MLIYEDIDFFGRSGGICNLKQCQAFSMDEHGWKWEPQVSWVVDDAKLQSSYASLGIEDTKSPVFCFIFCIWLCFVVLLILGPQSESVIWFIFKREYLCYSGSFEDLGTSGHFKV